MFQPLQLACSMARLCILPVLLILLEEEGRHRPAFPRETRRRNIAARLPFLISTRCCLRTPRRSPLRTDTIIESRSLRMDNCLSALELAQKLFRPSQLHRARKSAAVFPFTTPYRAPWVRSERVALSFLLKLETSPESNRSPRATWYM